jgi:hypothetical protein
MQHRRRTDASFISRNTARIIVASAFTVTLLLVGFMPEIVLALESVK